MARRAVFADRGAAGHALATAVARTVPRVPRPLVLALPRGGVPVAAPVAERLGADLGMLLARKIGAPGRPELGVGAIAEDGPPLFDAALLDALRLTADDLAGAVAYERAELARRARAYRGDRAPPDPAGRVVVLVDDGLATGVTARAALRWLRARGAARTVLAVPVCSPPARAALRAEADAVICLHAPRAFRAVGEWYTDFHQLSDEDVSRGG
jgi:predicted phosphoribosyltransferase